MVLQEQQWQTSPPLNHFYSSNCENIEQQELWQSVERFLKPWLQERKLLIKAWHQVLSKVIENEDCKYPVQHLCEILMDYISSGHFEIYEKLLEESRAFNDGFLSLAEPLYELIGHSTEHALRFNDRYSNERSIQLKKKQLPFELSRLGESLEQRFEAEDQLVKFLHQLHRYQSPDMRA